MCCTCYYNLPSQGKGQAFRYGGEEMLLLLYTDEAEAVAVAEDIRVKTAAQKSVYEDKTVSVTMTFGVTEFTDTDTFETVIDRADANLYYGKKHGKNCVVH